MIERLWGVTTGHAACIKRHTKGVTPHTLSKKGSFIMKTKRFFSALLVLCLTLALVLTASAAGNAADLDEAVQVVTALGIMSGDGSGDLGLSRRVTRAEFITMAIRATPDGGSVGQAASSPYPDVPRSHWASGYVEAAVSRRLISGFSDGTFRPEQEIKLAEGVVIALNLLGYSSGDFSGAYPTGQLALYHNLKLDRGISAANAADPLTRQDTAYLFYNLLSARIKDGIPYIQQLGHTLDASGRPDLVSLINGEMEGPVVAGTGWQSQISFTPVKVYRNGAAASLAAIQDYDVVYWNASMRTVWSYARKATGTIQAIEPSGANPTSVTVAGRTYPLESSAAAYALSDLGQYRLGDSVTLLLGRSGGVAAVADVSASAGERVGVVTDVSSASYSDGAGGSYSAQTVTLLAADGQTYQYQIQGSGVKEGALIRATVSAQGGEVTLRTLSSAPLTGKVNSSGTKLEQHPFSQNVEILDVSGNQGAVLYPSRLAGLTLTKGQVRYSSLNAQGEVETLILNNVTGDMHQYGILTSLDESGQDMSKFYSYEFMIGDQTCAVPPTTTRWPVSAGPIQVVGSPASPDRLLPLTATKAGQLTGSQFTAGGQKYTLSDSVVVYEYRNGQYYLSTLARAEQSEGTLTAWFDKAESAGGRIRIIIVK